MPQHLTTLQQARFRFTVMDGQVPAQPTDKIDPAGPQVATSDATVMTASVSKNDAAGNALGVGEWEVLVKSVAASPLVDDPNNPGTQIPREDRVSVTVDGDTGPGERLVSGAVDGWTVIDDPSLGASTLNIGAITVEPKS